MKFRSVLWTTLAAAGMLVPTVIPAAASQKSPSSRTADAPTQKVSDDVFAESLRLRQEYGFEADTKKLDSILANRRISAESTNKRAESAESLVNEWGFIGTAAEAAEMKRRDALLSGTKSTVERFAKQANYAGHYLDTQNRGRLVVQFAGKLPAQDTRGELVARAVKSGSSADDVEFRTVEHSSAELTGAMRAVWKSAESAGRNKVQVVSVEEDVTTNRLKIALRPGAEPDGVRGTLRRLDIPADITEGEGADLACSSRNNCASPRRGGVGVKLPGGYCTIGWVVKRGSSYGAVTAGHCDWRRNGGAVKSGSATYGSLTNINALKNGTHADMRYIKISSGAKPWLYQNNSSKGRVVKKESLGSVGDTSCLFGRNSANPRCGKISSTNASHRSDTCSCVVYGQSAASFSAAPGDSGGAVASSSTGSTARGVLSGKFGGKMHYSSIGYASTYGMGKLARG
ncbi:hypothetical protein AB0H77_31775 [Streptomyces sp. NPDC050844]|uniref:hypothetical protein n=1 Tax=Streptomyces sp. NPDC050844 TaxID=3155790 RepID=UPI0033C3FB33